ncbi:hypothetical protein DNHGIG_19900 [Collibacillus ludicampi]|uniref:Uncharacterized protein n=2 Tax=Collibacillus ludicampi TaxID=2771369 RepID=A0AAV4LF57_9BACL|nr:hypothetical protein DNHGIG_19900 [Collibacillus ludicampi]
MVTFSKEETLPARSLRTLSQKELLELLSRHEKLGLIVNDELKIVMLEVETLEAMVKRIRELEDLVEDMELAKTLGDRVHALNTEWEAKPEVISYVDWFLQGTIHEKGRSAE